MMLTRRGLLAIGLGAVTAGVGLAQKARGGDSVLRVRPHQPVTSVVPELGHGAGARAPYSIRNATTGSIRDARRAGR
jgi:hypothetical protein